MAFNPGPTGISLKVTIILKASHAI